MLPDCRNLQLFQAPRKAVANGTGVSVDGLALLMGGAAADGPAAPLRSTSYGFDSSALSILRVYLLFDP